MPQDLLKILDLIPIVIATMETFTEVQSSRIRGFFNDVADMISAKRILTTTAIVAITGLGIVASASSASAYVVCNQSGDCWHTDHRYHYHRDLGARYHNDDWYFHQRWNGDNDHHYRDYHEGRGGYRNGIWFSF